MSTPDQQRLKAYVLLTWANNHRKSSLSVLTLLLINSQTCWSGTIQLQLETIIGGDISLDRQSVNRLLRRLEHLDLIQAEEERTCGGGAPHKNFMITKYGREVLREHCTSTLGYLQSSAFQQILELALTEPASDTDGPRSTGRRHVGA